MAGAITTQQLRTIYALASKAGIVDRSRSDDNLHLLVQAETQKEHLSDLTYGEAQHLVVLLRGRVDTVNHDSMTNRREQSASGGVTDGQKRKIWKLMYLLVGCDQNGPAKASVGKRLCGIIHRQFGIDADAKDPTRWMTYKQANKLIEILKKYIDTAEKRLAAK